MFEFWLKIVLTSKNNMRYFNITTVSKLSAPRPTRRKALGGVYYFLGYFMSVVPNLPRAIAFIDGQNLFYAAQEAFGMLIQIMNPFACLGLSLKRKVGN